MMVSHVDSQSAKRIAGQFLRQHFCVQKIDADLHGRVWTVSAVVESYGRTLIEVIEIDAVTGQIQNIDMKESA